MGGRPLEGLRVGVTAPASSGALVRSLVDMGAAVRWGPAFETAPAPAARVTEESRAAVDGAPACVVVTTASGLHRWLAAAGAARDGVLAMLAATPVAARGHKAAAACVSYGGVPALVPTSERGSDLAAAVIERVEEGDAVAVQVDGGESPDLVAALVEAGLRTHVVRPYRWTPPPDPTPARALVEAAAAGELDAVTFTSPPAVAGLLEVAADLGLVGDLERALATTVKAAAIGAVTAEALEARGIPVAIYPVRPRTGALLTALSAAARLPRPPPLVRLDPAARTASRGDGVVGLSEREFLLLSSLARRPAATCPTAVLVREVWGADGERRRLQVLVSRLRSRVAPLAVGIASVPKRGYRLVLDPADGAPDRPGTREAPSLR